MPLDHSDSRLTAPPLLWLHGFTQTGSSAHQFRSILTATREMLTPDLARHGRKSNEGGSLDEIADEVAEKMTTDVVDLGGYSFGARVALHVALRHPTRIRRLVLLGATRGIESEELRASRRQRDNELAEHIESVGTEQFLREWLSQAMFADLPDDPVERAAREDQSATALASSLREAGTGTQRWLGNEITSIAMPLLAIAGAHDERFMREARMISRSVEAGSFQFVPGAGHAAHLHQPAWSARLVNSFLTQP
jgi:2-succinyl-6-hydroxy-2,4-cyclohexadiene-1-carboxylate synthase